MEIIFNNEIAVYLISHIYGAYQDRTNTNYINDSLGGYGDIGGGSRYFPIIKYCPKVAPHERQLSNKSKV